MLPSASVIPSGQHPNRLSLHIGLGHPLLFFPLAGDTPSGQQPYLVSLHVSASLHPSPNGPSAAVTLSGQHPNLDFKQAGFFAGFGLHLLGFCSLVIMSSNVFGVLPHKSVSVVRSELDVLDESVELSEELSVERVDISLVDSVDSVELGVSVDSDGEVSSLDVDSVDTASVVSVETCSVDDVDSVLSVDPGDTDDVDSVDDVASLDSVELELELLDDSAIIKL